MEKPDYQGLIENGVPVDVTYFIKTVRDSVPTAPVYLRSDDTPEKRLERQKEYVDTVREIQSVVENAKSKPDVFNVFKLCMLNNGYYEMNTAGIGSHKILPTEKRIANKVIDDKLARSLYFRSEQYYSWRITRNAEKLQYGVSKEEKIPKGYEIKLYDGKNSY